MKRPLTGEDSGVFSPFPGGFELSFFYRHWTGQRSASRIKPVLGLIQGNHVMITFTLPIVDNDIFVGVDAVSICPGHQDTSALQAA
jgi:hypothetical protein